MVPILTDLFNCQLKTFELLPSNKIGATRHLSKTAQNITPLLSELRPLTMLNTDYRILTKVLSKRILNVVSSVIKSNQSCCIPGSNISSLAFNILSMIHSVESSKGKAAILSLDLEKAHD